MEGKREEYTRDTFKNQRQTWTRGWLVLRSPGVGSGPEGPGLSSGELPEPQRWLRLLPTVQGRDSKDSEWRGSTSDGCAQDGIVKSASRITGLRTPDHGAHLESVASWSLEGRMTHRQHGTVMRVGREGAGAR